MQDGELHEPPSNPIHVTLDGEVTSAFEWMGAGHYRPDARSGAMHGGDVVAREMFYGSNGTELFVRLDAAGKGKFGIEFENGSAEAHVVAGRIVEMEAPRKGDRFRDHRGAGRLAPVTMPAEGGSSSREARPLATARGSVLIRRCRLGSEPRTPVIG